MPWVTRAHRTLLKTILIDGGGFQTLTGQKQPGVRSVCKWGQYPHIGCTGKQYRSCIRPFPVYTGIADSNVRIGTILGMLVRRYIELSNVTKTGRAVPGHVVREKAQ